MKKRLIVTGCSFTRYLEPTWPLFLSPHFDMTYNFAIPGAGNEYIFHSLINADEILDLNENDTVAIIWSGVTRVDHTDDDMYGWVCKGDISHRPANQLSFFNQYFPERLLEFKSINYILHAYRYLKLKKINFVFSSLYSLKEYNLFKNIENKIQDRFICSDGINEFRLNLMKNRHEPTKWSHPNPIEHYTIAKMMSNKLGLELNENEENLAKFTEKVVGEEYYHKICNNLRKTMNNRFINEFDIDTVHEQNGFKTYKKYETDYWKKYYEFIMNLDLDKE